MCYCAIPMDMVYWNGEVDSEKLSDDCGYTQVVDSTRNFT